MKPPALVVRGALLLVVLAFLHVTIRADEKPAVAPGLQIHVDARVPARFDLTSWSAWVDQYLAADEAGRAVAAQRLAGAAPLSALAVHARMADTPAGAERDRLVALERTLLVDAPATARVLGQYADALSTVSAAAGPLEFRAPETLRLRAAGKVFHACFLDPQLYGTKLDQQLTMITPYLDLPAASAVYRCAGAIWTRLASAATDDPAAAATCAAESARCAKRAEETSRDGAEVD